jgi:hypothetical protein
LAGWPSAQITTKEQCAYGPARLLHRTENCGRWTLFILFLVTQLSPLFQTRMLFSQSQEDLNGIDLANYLMAETNRIEIKCGYVVWSCCSDALFENQAVWIYRVS